MRNLPLRSIAIAIAMAAGACTSKPDPHAAHQAASAAAPVETPPATVARVNAAVPPGPAPAGMVWVPGGTFWMGCENCGMPDALPAHLVAVDGFWMDRAPVTNAEFERFVTATGYVTVAERPLDPRDYPGVPRDKLVPGSAVFIPTSTPVPLDNPLQWWRYTPGANWKHPEGPGSSLKERSDHPVVHVAFEDVAAYAKWASKRLPTEAEFEFAARGGLDRHMYPWGNELTPGGKAAANIWQGQFPAKDRGEDGYLGTSPVTAFPPNGFGLVRHGRQRLAVVRRLVPAGRLRRADRRPSRRIRRDRPTVSIRRNHARRSASCAADRTCARIRYCARYLVGSRGKGEVTSGTSNLGFRLVQSATR